MTENPEDLLRSEELTTSGWDALAADVDQDLAAAQRELKELNSMITQSKTEVDRLAQRNASITMHLETVKEQIGSMPASDIQTAYDAALDAQQRMVLMRGQLEKLQSDQNHLDRYVKLLNKSKALISGADESQADGSGVGNSSFDTGEMLIQAQESERLKLSRRMHDGPAQTLSNFILQTEIAMRLFEIDQDKAKEELMSLKGAASKAFQQVRDFIFDLRPMMLDDLGLTPTAKRYIEHTREKAGMDVSIQITGNERRLASHIEVMLFRAMQELLNNSVLHSQATEIKVNIDMAVDTIRVSVEDDGRGFDPADLGEDEAGIGMKLIKDRAEMLGGNFSIDSAIGKGARFVIDIPAINA